MVNTANVPMLIGTGHMGTRIFAEMASTAIPSTTRTARLIQTEVPSVCQIASCRTPSVVRLAIVIFPMLPKSFASPTVLHKSGWLGKGQGF